MAAKAGWVQSDEARAKIAAAAKRHWSNPDIRDRMREGMREAWRRKREAAPCCPRCGQLLPGRVVE